MAIIEIPEQKRRELEEWLIKNSGKQVTIKYKIENDDWIGLGFEYNNHLIETLEFSMNTNKLLFNIMNNLKFNKYNKVLNFL